MNCVVCGHGETRPGMATVTLERGPTTVILKEVPADICGSCGEYYLSDLITTQVMDLANDAALSGNEVEILKFVA